MDHPVISDPVIDHIRSIVDRHAFPPFVVGFDIRFDELDGMPIVWIVFKTTGRPDPDLASLRARGKALHSLTFAVATAVGEEVQDWSPRTLIESAETPGIH